MNTMQYYVVNLSVDGNIQLSTHFKAKEFQCKDGSSVVFVSAELLEVLEDIRKHFGTVITINSGYRTVKYNSSLSNSSSKSQHCLGKAADIVVRNYTPEKVYAYLNNKYSDKYGIGIYDSFVHVDVRRKKSRWDYRKAGA